MVALLSEITAILRRLLRGSELEFTPTTRFDEINDWDAMDLITVVVEVETRFDLQFEFKEIDSLITVGDLLHMIAAKQALTSA